MSFWNPFYDILSSRILLKFEKKSISNICYIFYHFVNNFLYAKLNVLKLYHFLIKYFIANEIILLCEMLHYFYVNNNKKNQISRFVKSEKRKSLIPFQVHSCIRIHYSVNTSYTVEMKKNQE